MVGKSRYCEICGVREIQRGGFFASFPIDESRCKAWVKLVGKEDLVHVPIEKLHEVRHVCGDHFEKRDFGKTGNKLKKGAYPKLNLSAPPLSDHQLRAFPQHVASKLGSSLAVLQVTLEPTPSTSREPLSTSIKNLNGVSAGRVFLTGGVSGKKGKQEGNKSSKIPGSTVCHEVPVADGVHNDTLKDAAKEAPDIAPKEAVEMAPNNPSTEAAEVAPDNPSTEAAEVASDNAPTDPDPPDLESRESIEAVFSWDAKELITAEDDTDVLQYHQEVSARAVLDRDLVETSLYHDDDPYVCDSDHHSYCCNECGGRILGFRYTCVQCSDWDLCDACEARAAHAAHYLLRIPTQRPYKEIQTVLATIRQHLLSENHFEPERAHSVKSEPEELQELQEPQQEKKPQETQESPPEGDPLGDCTMEFLDSSDIDDVPEVLEENGAPPAKRARAALLESPLHASTTLTSNTTIPDCTEPILTRLPILIKEPKIVNETSKVSPVSSRSEDKLDPHRTEKYPETAITPSTIPNIESPKNILVQIPAGFEPVGVVKMLNPKASVRLKPIEECSASVVNEE